MAWYVAITYLVILIYALLLVLDLLNMWMIFYKQKKYKNLPILMFYAFGTVAISLRLIYVIFSWTDSFVYNLDYNQ